MDEIPTVTLYDRELLDEIKWEENKPEGQKLSILMENMGRVNFGPNLERQRKGIDGSVQVNGHNHYYWKEYTLPMEHLEHLDETWERLRELLSDRGVLIVAVPNCSSYDAVKYGKYWAAYGVPGHLWHFTPVTIQQFASKHGFIMAARHPMPFDAFYVSMLSEKHRGSSFPFMKGMWVGTMAWLGTLTKKERSSSMIYVFRKKR